MNKEHDLIDLEKLLLSIMVVMIHTKLFDNSFNAILRVAVPIFFIYSSVFFFSSKKLNIKKFLKRTLLLYFSWFIILFPITYIVRGYSKLTILELLLDVFISFLRGSTFLASWYLSALIISILIIYFLNKHFQSTFIVVLTVPCYIFALITSNYHFLIENNCYLESIFNSMIIYVGSPINNFIVGLFWISIGNLIVDKEKTLLKASNKLLLVLSIVFCVLLLFENLTINFISKNNDSY